MTRHRPLFLVCLCLCLSVRGAIAAGGADKPFVAEVVDQTTGRGVPLVELSTVNGVRFVTDSAGIAAIDDPELMNDDVFFHVKSHGYEFPKDGFGYRGKSLKVVPGGLARLELKRLNVAERLYRVTGAGIYRDSILAGRIPPIKNPLSNAKVYGSDSVACAIYRGKIHWFWGDTNRPSYPLGNFHVPHATSLLPKDGGLDPEVGIDLEYDKDAEGFAASSCRMPGEGPTWIDGLVVLTDSGGRERMFAKYVKVKNLLDVYERGLVEWDDEERRFRHVETFPNDARVFPAGHPFRSRDRLGREFLRFGTVFPTARVPATVADLKDLSRYQVLTCLAPESEEDRPVLERSKSGALLLNWKDAKDFRIPAELDAKRWETWVKRGAAKPEEYPFRLRDAETGRFVNAHGGSIEWNPYRKRWILIAVEVGGSSFLGEVWFAEADSPTGPWGFARKILTHDRYSFYNPKHHAFFDKNAGRTIFFEGTYTITFSGNPAEPTPRYDYNQIMYRLDLADPRLNLPAAVYRTSKGYATAAGSTAKPRDPVAFFAWERPAPGLIPIAPDATGRLRILEKNEPGRFYAYPVLAKDAPPHLSRLREYRDPKTGESVYSTDPVNGERPIGEPLCLVWPKWFDATFPAD